MLIWTIAYIYDQAQTHLYMLCNFDLCEFYNVVLGGLLIGIITSFLFVWLTRLIHSYNFKARYKYLESVNNDFDWIAYDMKKSNERLREDCPNGSKANIKVVNGKINIKLEQQKESDSVRTWEGEIIIQQPNFGVIIYKYIDEHEYGRRECVIGEYIEGTNKFDFIFLTPLNDTIYFIEKQEDGRLIPTYNYEREILIRKRPGTKHGMTKSEIKEALRNSEGFL